MKALVWDGQALRLARDRPWPTAGEGQVCLRVRAAGICDTDLQIVKGYLGFQGVLGHEFVGEDDQGRRFVAEINQPCGGCPTCRAGQGNHCPTRGVLGIVGRDGAMAEAVAVPRATLHPVPDALADEQAVFVEPLAAAFRVLEQVPVQPGQAVAVVGDGKLGLLCAWVLRSAGARVTLVGRHAAKLALAGPEIDARREGEVEDRLGRCAVVVEATGSPSGLASAVALCRPRGVVVLKTTVAAPHALSLAPLVIDELTVIGSRCGPFPRALAALERGEIDVRPLIQEVFPLEEGEAAFQAAQRRGAAKVLLRP